MLVGYNTNISYKGNVYHIQTEDSGQGNPVVVTLLYQKGAILASKKTSYAQIISDSDFREKVRKVMQIQHKGMIRELLSGKYSGEYGGEDKREAAETGETKSNSGRAEAAGEAAEASTGETGQEQAKQPGEQAAEKSRLTKSLDDILLNHIMKRGK